MKHIQQTCEETWHDLARAMDRAPSVDPLALLKLVSNVPK
jgi:hypothetical protein